MGTLKFKVGDKVRVKSLEWYNENKNLDGEIINKEGEKNGVFTKYMRSWCGDVIKINSVKNNYYGANNGWSWYDWMLEDDVVTEEPVTEEKQEVEQLNKKDMETKEMTQQEIFAYLNDTKILCTSREESKKVQEKLFALGFCYYGEKSNEVVDSAFTLYINIHNKMQFGSDLSMWVDDGARRIEPNEILAIQIKEEKPKFDPKTLQDFQKVLYRFSNADWWKLGFFAHYNEIQNNKFWIIGQDVQPYEQCVPFNEETKKLKGTSKDAPDYYKNW